MLVDVSAAFKHPDFIKELDGLTVDNASVKFVEETGVDYLAVAVGTAKITVTADGGKTATCDVTVTSADKKYNPCG